MTHRGGSQLTDVTLFASSQIWGLLHSLLGWAMGPVCWHQLTEKGATCVTTLGLTSWTFTQEFTHGVGRSLGSSHCFFVWHRPECPFKSLIYLFIYLSFPWQVEFPGQGSNALYSSDRAGSVTCCPTRELPECPFSTKISLIAFHPPDVRSANLAVIYMHWCWEFLWILAPVSSSPVPLATE